MICLVVINRYLYCLVTWIISQLADIGKHRQNNVSLVQQISRMLSSGREELILTLSQLLPDRHGGLPESSLSLRSHGGGIPPPPGPGEGGVTTSYSRSIADSTGTSLLRGTGGFYHLRESLNPFIYTGGPRRGRSFRRRLRRWCWWHGSWSVEMTSYVYVVASEYVSARLRRH